MNLCFSFYCVSEALIKVRVFSNHSYWNFLHFLKLVPLHHQMCLHTVVRDLIQLLAIGTTHASFGNYYKFCHTVNPVLYMKYALEGNNTLLVCVMEIKR